MPGAAAPIGDLDLHLFGQGRHLRLWELLGAHLLDGTGPGARFTVWAPNARRVAVTGDFSSWGDGFELEPVGESGIWTGEVASAAEGHHYKLAITDAAGHRTLRADPMARQVELPPGNASRLNRSRHVWGDEVWMAGREQRRWDRLSVYEVHLGSWRRHADGGPMNARELAPLLADHVEALGFTHVELMPVAAHPFGGSWGYQVTGYFATAAQYGTPDDLRYLVDHLHQRGIGVILDWVPAHFPKDAWALARFDGTALYEHEDPRRGEHPDWGTLVFNLSRHEVRNFLLANAMYWVEELHADGLRVDAVASMLYLDYSRSAGEWAPNVHGGRENLEAIDFLREVNATVGAAHPGVLMIAEESTAWPGVTAPTDHGGLGFTHKWNLGWMNDTLHHLGRDPVHRRYHHNELTFSMVYAYSEHYLLPLSHDEVVHGKGSLIARMPGDHWQAFAGLRLLLAWMWAHPGRQLLFMGGEWGQEREWSHDRSLDWHLLEGGPNCERHAGVMALVAELNRLQAAHPALWRGDDDPAGFRWLDADDSAGSAFSFVRSDPAGTSPVVCAANFTPVPRHGYRVGLPVGGEWRELLSTDEARFGGSDVLNPTVLADESTPWQGCDSSAVVVLPPLGLSVFGVG